MDYDGESILSRRVILGGQPAFLPRISTNITEV
jgi:hypothetical protein